MRSTPIGEEDPPHPVSLKRPMGQKATETPFLAAVLAHIASAKSTMELTGLCCKVWKNKHLDRA